MFTAPTGCQEGFSTAVLIPVVEALEDKGVNVCEALAGVRLAPAQIAASENIAADDILQVYDNAAKLVSDPDFGLHVGTRYHLSSSGMLGFAILSSTKFEQAISHIQKYHQAGKPTLEVYFQYY